MNFHRVLQKVGMESVLPLPEGRFRLLQLSWISHGISSRISCGISCGISYLRTSALRQGPKDGQTDGRLRFQAHVAAPDRAELSANEAEIGLILGKKGWRLPAPHPAPCKRAQAAAPAHLHGAARTLTLPSPAPYSGQSPRRRGCHRLRKTAWPWSSWSGSWCRRPRS